MATPGQDMFLHKFTKSGRVVPPHPPAPHKKPRSNSVSAQLQPELEQNDETTAPTSSERLDFSELRKKFEAPPTPEISEPHIVKKRPSVSVISIPGSPAPQTNTSSFSYLPSPTSNNIAKPKLIQTKTTTTTRTTFVRPSQFPKARSSSPEGRHISLVHDILRRISINNLHNNGINSSIEEQDDPTIHPSSPLPSSADSSILSENDVNEKPHSVQKIRDFFDKQENPHVYQPSPSRTSQPITKPPTPGIVKSARPPPPRPPPRPEKYLKSQLSGWHSAPSFDTADSATGDSSLSSNQNLSRCNSSDVSFSDEEEDLEADRRIKLRKCIEEVHTTEKTYVNILYVLSVKLSAEVRNTCDKDDNLILTFNNTYKPLLATIQQIYKFHHDLLLPEIEEYITNHRTGNMWSALENNFKVIEVLYKDYYVKYYENQGKLDDLCKNHPLINEAMLKCQVHLGNLYPITQLNCANQRLLRYILCMKTYMKYLDDTSAEYKHTRSIHDGLDRIAMRCEEELAISPAQLTELSERLDNKFECIKNHRKLLWHGPIKKQSPRRHLDIAQRYMILFSDCLLVCNEESGRKLDIKRELSLRGITIDFVKGGRASIITNNDQQNNTITYYPFRVNAVEKSYEFLADKESDREVWVKKIRQASDAFNKRNTTIEIRQSVTSFDEQQLGIRAPAWVHDRDVTRCQNCNNRFPPTLISSRRHHCRSCGCCICGSCSTKKLILEYCKQEGEVRVCDACYTHFTGTVLSKNTSIWPKSTREIDQTILFGDFSTVNSGATVWIALQEDYQLHVYGARLDQAEDYAIKLSDLIDLQLESETRTFTLRETTKTHTFNIESTHQINFQKNDSTEEKMKIFDNKLTFYTNLWFEAMQSARSGTLPEWYIRKRDSADSGVSNIG